MSNKKVLYSAMSGAIEIQEEGGVISLVWNESLGGGAAAGIVKGQGSLQLDAMSALKLGEALLNAKLPPAVAPLAVVIEGIVNQAISAVE